ncbi:MAG: hypothetical protein K2X82_06325 [Gemmataceae bacterium]|nr:hypothetical protein [Gemmataceae bacterium]
MSKPVHEIRLGRVRAAVWVNEGANGPFLSVTLSRLYKDESGKWADAQSFDRDDLPLVAKVADRAHTWIHESRPRGWAVVEGGGEQSVNMPTPENS